MINTDRIIPIMAVDRLSLIGETLTLIGTSYTAVAAEDVEGNFKITGSGAAGNKLCNQAAKSIDFVSGVTSATVYFIPGFGFEGFKIAGVAVTPFPPESSTSTPLSLSTRNASSTRPVNAAVS